MAEGKGTVHEIELLRDSATGELAAAFDGTLLTWGSGGPYRAERGWDVADAALRRAGLLFVGEPPYMDDPCDMGARAAAFSERLGRAMDDQGVDLEWLYGRVDDLGGDAYMVALERCLEGEFPSDVATLIAIARALGVSSDWLLGL